MEEVKIAEIVSAYVPGEWTRAQSGDAKAAESALENDYRRCLAAYGRDTAMVQALQMERHGGECMYCHKAFRRVSKARRPDGRYLDCGAFYWFEPACGCYTRCMSVELSDGVFAKGCGRYLVYERFANLRYCASCRPLRDEKDKDQKKPGRNVARLPFRERNVAQKVGI